MRLTKDAESLGLPTINVLGRVVELGPDAVAGSRGTRSYSSPDLSEQEQDANKIQHLVEYMPAELKTVFEAYHLAWIAGTRHYKSHHGQRASALKISRSTYFVRVKAAESFIGRCLHLDSM